MPTAISYRIFSRENRKFTLESVRKRPWARPSLLAMRRLDAIGRKARASRLRFSRSLPSEAPPVEMRLDRRLDMREIVGMGTSATAFDAVEEFCILAAGNRSASRPNIGSHPLRHCNPERRFRRPRWRVPGCPTTLPPAPARMPPLPTGRRTFRVRWALPGRPRRPAAHSPRRSGSATWRMGRRPAMHGATFRQNSESLGREKRIPTTKLRRPGRRAKTARCGNACGRRRRTDRIRCNQASAPRRVRHVAAASPRGRPAPRRAPNPDGRPA